MAPTPVRELDLEKEGYGHIFVKDESVNPTGTHKDRAFFEETSKLRDYAQAQLLNYYAGLLSKDDIEKLEVPRLSLLTSGNAGAAAIHAYEQYNMPPPKLLLANRSDWETIQKLGEQRADIYLANIHQRALRPEEIRALTHNTDGIDLTSDVSREPHAEYYDWLSHEVLNFNPSSLYVPFGTGRLLENILIWQYRSVQGLLRQSPDNRLDQKNLTANVLARIPVFAAEPSYLHSIADKLTAPFKPFLHLTPDQIHNLRKIGATAPDTGIYEVEEPLIEEAWQVYQRHGIQAEPSGAAALALYMKQYKAGKKYGERPLVINTGMGKLLDQLKESQPGDEQPDDIEN